MVSIFEYPPCNNNAKMLKCNAYELIIRIFMKQESPDVAMLSSDSDKVIHKKQIKGKKRKHRQSKVL